MMRSRIRRIVLGVGVGASPLALGCSATGQPGMTPFTEERPDDGRSCEIQCANLARARTSTATRYFKVEVDDCDKANGQVRCMLIGYTPGVGRPPPGFTMAGAQDASLGERFAEMAAAEAASAPAFRWLARALEAHGAPARLIRGARLAARDEVEHARLAASWRRAFGARPRRWRAELHGTPSLEALAADNAVQGCVGETWGAVLLAAQAEHAATPALRATFARLARDEARHAALSHAIDRWASRRLPPAAERRIAELRARAIAAAREAPEPSEGDALLGLPSPAARAHLFEASAPLFA